MCVCVFVCERVCVLGDHEAGRNQGVVATASFVCQESARKIVLMLVLTVIGLKRPMMRSELKTTQPSEWTQSLGPVQHC